MADTPSKTRADDPRQAVESGEPELTGRRSHGRDAGAPAGTDEVTDAKTDDPRQAPESGRHGENG